MAWTQVSEQGQLATSETNADEKTALRVFFCKSSTPTTTVAAERASYGGTTIPVKGEGHPDDAGRKVKTITAKSDEEGNREIFFVEVQYSDKQTVVDNPVDKPATYEWDSDDATEPYFIDRSDTPKSVCNSAGERFAEFRERETGSHLCIVTKNVVYSSYDPTIGITFKDAVNSGGFTVDGQSVSAGQCKCKKVAAGPKQTASYTTGGGGTATVVYREVKAYLQFRQDGWDDVVEDRGFNELNSGKLKEISKGTPPTKPEFGWPLNGSGGAKANVTDTPSTITFKPYRKISFGPLGLS